MNSNKIMHGNSIAYLQADFDLLKKMIKIPAFTEIVHGLYLFNGKLQVWKNPCYLFYITRDSYDTYNRVIIRLGKYVICFSRSRIC